MYEQRRKGVVKGGNKNTTGRSLYITHSNALFDFFFTHSVVIQNSTDIQWKNLLLLLFQDPGSELLLNRDPLFTAQS